MKNVRKLLLILLLLLLVGCGIGTEKGEEVPDNEKISLNLSQADLIADITDNKRYLNEKYLYSVDTLNDSDIISVIITVKSEGLIDYYQKDNQGYSSLDSYADSEAGTYVVILTSTVNPEITTTLEITVEEPADMAEVLNGEYVYKDFMLDLSYVFTPESEGAVKGDLTITNKENVGEFTYEWDGSELIVSPKEGSESFMYGVIFMTSTQSLWCASMGWEIDELSRKTTSDEGAISGTYYSNDKAPFGGFNRDFELTFDGNGTGTFSFYYYFTGSFNWELDDENNITFTNVAEDWGAECTFTGTYNVDEDTISFTYSIYDGESTEDNELVFNK